MNKLLRLLALVAATACASESENTTTAAPECFTGLKWAGGDNASVFMNPGRDCVACHTQRGEGPKLAIAGTVFGQIKEPDLCEGKAGITVEITDAKGKIVRLTSNEAGNFLLDEKNAGLALPYTAKVQFAGKERKMLGAQSNGSCNSCHTATGISGAPGRLVVP